MAFDHVPQRRSPAAAPHTALDCLVWCRLGWVTQRLHPLVIAKLAQHGELTVTQIRTAIHTTYTHSHVVRLVNDLIAVGLVYSHPHSRPEKSPRGGSAPHGYSLTDQGKQLVQQAEGARKK